MAHHHKSNKDVEGAPNHGHGRGLPRRPDDGKLERRVEEDREAAGLTGSRATRRARRTARIATRVRARRAA
ncbi:hypothetical protein [Streptomyces sp. JJ38]|uniref:hypothetical protein n=1 Tax=Streptomyces sp. JJ38 TaxID=2738128 RepID=UPI001C586D51|nr:hypothetical protein [Streptomyces sp. JJ38]MBW1595595.1 hypothetical protein [Streptomyces sp. JJ38]